MGASQSEVALPFPHAWLPEATPEQQEAAKKALLALSKTEPSAFLAVAAPLPELEAATWDFEKYSAHAQVAMHADPGMNSLTYLCIPKLSTESEFWRCYFCHAYVLVTPRGGASAAVSAKVDASPPPPPPPSSAQPTSATVSFATLQLGDDTTSNAIISAFTGDAEFDAFSKKEMEGIMARDAEDDEKLAAGIRMAVSKGVCAADPPVEMTTMIDVLGKSADAVAAEIVAALGDAPSKGCVLVLTGLSGTGKGTTVDKLKVTLPRATAWSNGNVFRSITLLALSACEASGTPFSQEALTPELLAQLMGCLEFGKFNGKFDISIKGYGHDLLVSEVANTVLKDPKVGKNIPTVAEMTQGEVITFASAAAAQMGADGMNVLMEGRAQTLNYVRTPHRFELTLSQPLIIGMRRAAQRMLGAAQDSLKQAGAGEASTPEDVKAALAAALKSMNN